MQRLQREAQALAKLSHPNVVIVYDVGSFEGQVFLAMEYVDGTSLRTWRHAAPRTTREILSMYVQAGRGLAAAHAAGILHRDFKPDNAVVDAPGRVRVLDFGVARIDAPPSTLDRALVGLAATEMASTPARGPMTQAGTLVGTPPYMAPEQLRGERAEPRTDEFTFCVALYEALSMTSSHTRGPPWAVCSPVSWPSASARSCGSARLRAALRGVLLRGIRARPEDRFASMTDLLAALESASAAPRRRALVAASVVGAGAVVALAATRPSPPVQCAGAGEDIAQTWGEAQRAAVRRAFEASANPRASDVWGRIRPKLDEYAASWATMRTESCQATQVKGVQSAEALDLRSACLDQRRRELASTAGLLAGADAKLVDDAIGVVRGLTDLSQCADVPSSVRRTRRLTIPRSDGRSTRFARSWPRGSPFNARGSTPRPRRGSRRRRAKRRPSGTVRWRRRRRSTRGARRRREGRRPRRARAAGRGARGGRRARRRHRGRTPGPGSWKPPGSISGSRPTATSTGASRRRPSVARGARTRAWRRWPATARTFSTGWDASTIPSPLSRRSASSGASERSDRARGRCRGARWTSPTSRSTTVA